MVNDMARLYSYTKVWKVKKKIYTFYNIVLPVPIDPVELLYFLIGVAFVWIIGLFIPVIASMPLVIRILAIPYGITSFLTKKKLDGKNPVKYAMDGIQYLFTIRGKRYDGFRREFGSGNNKIKLEWNTSKGTFR